MISNPNQFKLALISPEEPYDKESYWTNKLLEKVDYYHLRKPHWSFEKHIGFLKEISPEHKTRIVLHLKNSPGFNAWEKIGGVHLSFNSKTLPLEIPQSLRVSYSCHSIEECKEVRGRSEYSFLSPIFPSISKQGYSKKWNRKELGQTELSKVFALGGVKKENVSEVVAFGFGGAALMGSIWQQENPYETLEEIKKKI